MLTHWGRVTHICVSSLTIIGLDNGLAPTRRQAIIWTNAGILFIGPLRTNFSQILIEIYIFSFKKMQLKISSGKWALFCLGLNVLFNQMPDCLGVYMLRGGIYLLWNLAHACKLISVWKRNNQSKCNLKIGMVNDSNTDTYIISNIPIYL